VPNVLTNTADFIVLDHVNHFSVTSLRHLFHAAGLAVVEIDDKAHRGAFVIVARRADVSDDLAAPAFSLAVLDTIDRFKQLAGFWTEAGDKVRAFEADLPPELPVAIYGAGFYGAFIAAQMKHPERIVCHLDQNVYLQGGELNGRRILAPQNLSNDVDTVFVGLNPAHARRIIGGVTGLAARNLRYFFLD